jgi:hypothetical protein
MDDSHEAVSALEGRQCSKNALILCDTYANTTQYARKHGFTWSIDISLGLWQLFLNLFTDFPGAS